MQVTESRSTSAEDTGFRVMAPSAVGVPTTGYDVTVRSTPTNVVPYDNIAGSALVTISTTDMAAECEAGLTISGSSVWLAWRKVSNSPLVPGQNTARTPCRAGPSRLSSSEWV